MAASYAIANELRLGFTSLMWRRLSNSSSFASHKVAGKLSRDVYCCGNLSCQGISLLDPEAVRR